MHRFIVLALSAVLVFAAASTWLSLYPGVPADLGGVENLDDHAERVRIPVGEDDHVNGWWLRGSRRGVIVLLHGYARDHRRLWRYAQFLRRDGWSLVLIDFRSSRQSQRKPTTLGFWELADARAALDWVAREPALAGQRVGLFGESLGGSVALVLAAERPEVKATVVDSPFANGKLAIEDSFRYEARMPVWPFAVLAQALGQRLTGHDPAVLDAVPAVRSLGVRPLLLIQPGREDRFGLRQARMLEEAAGRGAQHWLVADAGHASAWATHREEYERRVRSFFRSQLPAPTPVAPKPARTSAGRAAKRPARAGGAT